MKLVTATSFGGSLPRSRTTPGGAQEPQEARGGRTDVVTPFFSPYGDPEPVVGKWAPWKVTLFVVLFCGAFWSGVGYLVLRLLS